MSIFTLGLQFAQQLPKIVRQELEQLVASIQTQGNRIGVFQVLPRAETFLSASTGSWVLSSGDYGYITYTIINNWMLVTVAIYNTTLSGGPAAELYLQIPEGRSAVPARFSSATYWVNGTDGAGRMLVKTTPAPANPSRIVFAQPGNWSNGSVALEGQLFFQLG